MQIVGTVIDKTWIVAHKAWLVIPAAVLVAVLIFVFLSIPSCQKPVINTQAIINDAQVAMGKEYDKQIDEKNVVIADYKSRLVVSDGKYQATVKKYNDLKREIANVQPPKTNEERLTRFTAAGFPPAVPIR